VGKVVLWKHERQNPLNELPHPESEAVKFYGMHHLVELVNRRYRYYDELPLEVGSVVAAYFNEMHEVVTRIAYYLLLISTREARHVKFNPTTRARIRNTNGVEAYDFVREIQGGSSDATVRHFLTEGPKLSTPLGNYLEMLEYVFSEGTFSGGYGGAPWAKIANTLLRTVRGETSLEVMADTAFTLAHNNGPIFNKGIFYKGYDLTAMRRVLDVQRSGQMLHYIIQSECHSTLPLEWMVKKSVLSSGEALQNFVLRALDSIGAMGSGDAATPFNFANSEEMAYRGYVDWQAVMGDGALGSYDGDVAVQQALEAPIFSGGEYAVTVEKKSTGGTGGVVSVGVLEDRAGL
jgi:hypothetical protein